jgi:hypothetical protein
MPKCYGVDGHAVAVQSIRMAGVNQKNINFTAPVI